MRQLLLKILPQFFINYYKISKKRQKQKHRWKLEKSNKIIREKDIMDQLLLAGIKNGDVVMMHSSLSKIGFVKDGAGTVVKACLNVVGTEGTVMMPAFPGKGFNYDYLNTNPLFNVISTPSKMGAVTEYFRRLKGIKRSLHPTDSVIAFGKEAVYLTKDHFGQLTPYNKSSPFYRLCELSGKIILIGVDLDSVTNLHTSEEAIENFEYPVYHEMVFNAKLIDESECLVTMQTKTHDPIYSKQRQCNALLPHFTNAGFLKYFTLGEAQCMVIDANAMHQWMIENYKTKGITMYTPNGKQ